ncbi:hypothetical protein EBU71_21010, partial [bacterium]|nr:hypothetical protein [Candidatus Elulimicrobium humile]
DFEKYIQEVKPYRSKIREFTSIYSNIENTNSLITDFDLPPFIRDWKLKNLETLFDSNSISVNNNNLITLEPWKSWYSNIGFSVVEIKISDPGSLYINKPKIEFVGVCTRPARARAIIVRGSIVKIEILDQGQGYFSPPTIIINSNLAAGGTIAKAYAIIGNNAIRANKISIKFDRYLKQTFEDIKPILVQDQFQGNGVITNYRLRYKPNFKSNTILVQINDKDQIIGSYIVNPLTSLEKGFTEHYAEIVFVDAPEDNSSIKVTYQKDFVHLNALERIYHHYDPQSGMIGRDFAQLMTGIDYGGVSVVGVGFEKDQVWDGEYGWGQKPWDLGSPTEAEIYDTIIDGGNLTKNSAYRSASGLKADDIIIDGDGFITPTTSPAPEEMLPGHVVDSVAIKVFERSLTTSSNII